MAETARSSHRARSWTYLAGGAIGIVGGAALLALGTEREGRAMIMVVGGVALALVGAYRFARPGTRLGNDTAPGNEWKLDVGWVVGSVLLFSLLAGLGIGGIGDGMSRPAAVGLGALVGLVAGLFVVVRRRLVRGARNAGRRLREG